MLVARWETRYGKGWFELHCNTDREGREYFHYRAANAGGNYGLCNREQAFRLAENWMSFDDRVYRRVEVPAAA